MGQQKLVSEFSHHPVLHTMILLYYGRCWAPKFCQLLHASRASIRNAPRRRRRGDCSTITPGANKWSEAQLLLLRKMRIVKSPTDNLSGHFLAVVSNDVNVNVDRQAGVWVVDPIPFKVTYTPSVLG